MDYSRIIAYEESGKQTVYRIGTVAEVDALVSWNFQHIVRLDKIQKINGINLELKHKPQVIYSLREGKVCEQKNEIRSVEMVRHILDEMAASLEGKSHAEIIGFFRKAGDVARKEAKRRRKIELQPESRG
jgi:hypothetical protein